MTTPPMAADTTARPPCQSHGSQVCGARASRTRSPPSEVSRSLRRGELTQAAATMQIGTTISQASTIAGGALPPPAAMTAAARHA